jgi:hypothetical protein
VTLEDFGSERPSERRVSGLPGAIHLGPPALGLSTFLLDPGGQDYVGKNSYDDTSENNTTTE